MKAVYFDRHGDLDVLRHGDCPEPEPGPGEVVLEMRAAALNFNDIWARRGLPRVHIPLPHVSGTDGAGVVAALGPGVTGIAVGDEVITYPVRACRRCPACLGGQEVFCKSMQIWGFQTGPMDGSYAQYARIQVEQLLPKPRGLSWVEAAATTTSLLSVWRMLVTRAHVLPGERVLVFGASGGTGSYALQLISVLGADGIAVTSSREKAEFCEQMGARHVIRADRSDVLTEVRKLTEGRGVDAVFDHVGETVWPIAVESLRWGGRMVICGATEGFQPTLDLRFLWNKQLTLLGSHIGTAAEWAQALRLIENGRIKPPVTRVFPLSEVRAAQELMETRGVMGKIAVSIGAS